jgi:hypothetical protein
MENKLRKEQLNRQDKVRKSDDYRETFIKESRVKSSSKHVEQFRDDLAYKQDLMERYCVCGYWIKSHLILLDWSLKDFATRNKLNPTDRQTQQLFESLRHIALEDFGAIIQSIRSARVVWDYDNQGNWAPSIEIKPSLKCDDVYPMTEEEELHIKSLRGKPRS